MLVKPRNFFLKKYKILLVKFGGKDKNSDLCIRFRKGA